MAFEGNKTYDFGNNETWKTGIYQEHDGQWTAMTFTQSRTFKTPAAAIRWLDKHSA